MKLLVGVAFVIIIIVAAVIFGSKDKNNSPSQKVSTENLAPIVKVEAKAVIQKETAVINNLVEIPNKDKAKVYQVNDKKAVEAKNAIFKKAYVGDLIVLLPDRTIIYDPSTKTIRDISNVILYESF